jgi:hypothetical protein
LGVTTVSALRQLNQRLSHRTNFGFRTYRR